MTCSPSGVSVSGMSFQNSPSALPSGVRAWVRRSTETSVAWVSTSAHTMAWWRSTSSGVHADSKPDATTAPLASSTWKPVSQRGRPASTGIATNASTCAERPSTMARPSAKTSGAPPAASGLTTSVRTEWLPNTVTMTREGAAESELATVTGLAGPGVVPPSPQAMSRAQAMSPRREAVWGRRDSIARN